VKLSSILKGRRARTPVAIRFGEDELVLDVRVLGPDDDIEIASAALAFAKTKGVASPGPGDDIYEKAARAETLRRACIDHDSPVDAPAPLFDTLEEILTHPDMTRDHISFIFEAQERWQDECSPRARNISVPDYIRMVAKTAEGDIGPFALCAPGAQWSFVRSMASQLLSLQTLNAPSSSPSAETKPT